MSGLQSITKYYWYFSYYSLGGQLDSNPGGRCMVVEVLRQCSYRRWWWWLSELVTLGGILQYRVWPDSRTETFNTQVLGPIQISKSHIGYSSTIRQKFIRIRTADREVMVAPASRRYVQYRVDQSLDWQRPRSLLQSSFFKIRILFYHYIFNFSCTLSPSNDLNETHWASAATHGGQRKRLLWFISS